jgi:segregation and condensation protein B
LEEAWELKPRIEALLVSCGCAVTVSDLARCLDVTVDQAEEAVREFEADLLGADRGIQLRRRPHGMRIETKPQYADLLGRLLPERRPKPMTAQALETLAIVALKQPVTIGDINAIRGIESASAVQTLLKRGLIARSARLGPRRAKLWRTTQVFLESFGLASLDELYKEGRMEEVFASVYSAEMGPGGAPATTSQSTGAEGVEAP